MGSEHDDDDYEDPHPAPIEPVATKRFGSDASLIELIEDDADQHMLILSMLKAGWQHVTNIDELCKMALTHGKILEMRRKHLLKPVEAPKEVGGGSNRLSVWDA